MNRSNWQVLYHTYISLFWPCKTLVQNHYPSDKAWRVNRTKDERKHALASIPIVFHQHRKLDEDKFTSGSEMLKAEAKPRLDCETMGDDDSKRMVISKDVSNFRTRLFPKLTISMERSPIWQNTSTSVVSLVSSTVPQKSFLRSLYQRWKSETDLRSCQNRHDLQNWTTWYRQIRMQGYQHRNCIDYQVMS